MGAIERFLIRTGILATPEQDAYFDRMERLLEFRAAHPTRATWEPVPSATPATDYERMRANLKARGYHVVDAPEADGSVL